MIFDGLDGGGLAARMPDEVVPSGFGFVFGLQECNGRGVAS